MKLETLLTAYKPTEFTGDKKDFNALLAKIKLDAAEFKKIVLDSSTTESVVVDRIVACAKKVEEKMQEEGKDIKLKFDEKTGKANAYRKSIHEDAKSFYANYAEDTYIKTKVFHAYNETQGKRFGPAFIINMCSSPEEVKKVLDYNNHKNDEVDPVTHKTYETLKKEFIMNGVDRCKNAIDALHNYKNDREFLDYCKYDYNAICTCTELEKDQINVVQEYFGVALDQKEIDAWKPYSYVASNIGNQRARLSLMANPYYEKMSPEDAAVFNRVLMDKAYEYGAEIEDVDKIFSQKDLETKLPNNFQMYANSAQPLGYQKVNEVEEEMYDQPSVSTQQQYAGNSIKFLLAKNYPDIDVNSVTYFDSKGKKLEENAVCPKAIKGDRISIIDKDGNFLMNFKSSNRACGLNQNEEQLEHQFGIKDKVTEQLLQTNLNLTEKDFKNLVNNVSKDQIIQGLNALKDELNQNNPWYARAFSRSNYGDIISNIDNIINKGDFSNKQAITSSLNSLKSDAGAYMASHMSESKLSVNQNRCNAMGKLFNSLNELNQDVKNVEALGEKLDLNKDSEISKVNIEKTKQKQKELKEYLERGQQREIIKKSIEIDEVKKNTPELNKNPEYIEPPVLKLDDLEKKAPTLEGRTLGRRSSDDN